MIEGFSVSQIALSSTFTKNQGLLLGENHHLHLSNWRHQGFRAHAMRCFSQLMQKDPAILCITEQYSLKQWLSIFLEFQKIVLKVRWLCTEKDYIPIITSKRMGGGGRHVSNFCTKTKEVISFKVFYLFFSNCTVLNF